jgi:hypothetical protein
MAYEGVGDVSEDDDFLNTLMTINAKKHMRNTKKSFNIWMV